MIKATQETIRICDICYPNIHHQNGPENAFRHALWSILICQNVFRVTKKEKSAVFWAEKITSLHEKLAPNSLLARTMDLHNNKMGRKYFLKLKSKSIDTIILFLREEVVNSKFIMDDSTIDLYSDNLVHIEKLVK